MKYQVVPYEEKYQEAVIQLVLSIQQIEFNVPITIQDQPDLQNVTTFYRKGNGNFWVALFQDKVVGTTALIDIGNDQVTLRKMFVHAGHRGKENGVAQLLFDTSRDWCVKRNVKEIFLGTIDKLHAAKRFYAKNGFIEIPKTALPTNFPIMRVDNTFFKFEVLKTIYHITTTSWWNTFASANEYETETLNEEGFIHCSTREQVSGVLERYYANQQGLLLLHINPALLKAKLKYEVATFGESFPHVFGGINKEAIFNVEELN